MVKLDKKEVSLWESPFETYYHTEDKQCDVEHFLLTNQNVRVHYAFKFSLFKREFRELVIPLNTIKVDGGEPAISLRYDPDEEVMYVTIDTASGVHEFSFVGENKRKYDKQLGLFIETLKKNGIPDHVTTSTITSTTSAMNSFSSSIPKASTLTPTTTLVPFANPLASMVAMPEIRSFLCSLGVSPFELSEAACKKIKKGFPVPSEHTIIWADCEFDSKCSGVVCTNKGCFIKTNVSFWAGLKKDSGEDTQSALYYFKWDTFSPAMFCAEGEGNYLLKVDPRCQGKFMAACCAFRDIILADGEALEALEAREFAEYRSVGVGVVQGMAAAPNANVEYIETHVRNVNGRHGFFAEEANNLADRLRGLKAKVVGGNFAKDGADRQIERSFGRDIFIQTKYCATAERSLGAAFDQDGMYRYIDKSGRPMQLEVPSDQYESVLEGFRQKMVEGKVVNQDGKAFTNPRDAEKYVRKGSITYQQAVNLAKPGNIDSIMYDVKQGVVNCSFAFGISCLSTIFFSYQKTHDMGTAIEEGIKAGVKVFGLTMLNHVLLSQLSRTTAFQNFTGNVVLRNNLIASGVSLVVYSIPDIYNLLSRNISFGQFIKNTAVLGGSILGGAVGANALGAIGERVGGGLGHIAGSILGGTLGAIAGSKAVKTVADKIREDDSVVFTRLLSAITSSMVVDYMLTEEEIEAVMKLLEKVPEKDMKALMKSYKDSAMQEQVISDFLEPYFGKVISSRRRLSAPDVRTFCAAGATS